MGGGGGGGCILSNSFVPQLLNNVHLKEVHLLWNVVFNYLSTAVLTLTCRDLHLFSLFDGEEPCVCYVMMVTVCILDFNNLTILFILVRNSFQKSQELQDLNI